MPPIENQCWNHRGVWGDSSCPQLKTDIHCRNCAVYVSAGRELLQRPAPAGYVEEWTQLLAKDLLTADSGAIMVRPMTEAGEVLSLMLFRIGNEWLALPVSVIKEATQVCPIHRLPHRTNHIFLGIVNIRGEILMCISLSDLLGLSSQERNLSFIVPMELSRYQRMMVLEIQDNRWVFPVDEISGVHRFSTKDLQETPAVVSKTPDTYTKKIITWQNKQVNYLDELLFYELLFYTLNRS